MKTIRDPVHGMIPVSDNEMSIINLPIFQRLRYVKQLTSVELVFPSALHNRFCHSIGAMHLAGMYATDLDLNDTQIKHTRIAALLHDIGHGPFSHIWDRVVYSHIYSQDNVADGVKSAGHDQHRLTLIDSDVLKPHLEKININPNEIIKIWTNATAIHTAMNMIVQGPLGGDRMDFILRDAYFTGTQHFGTIAYDRIIYSSYIEDDLLYYQTKAIGDIIHALKARQYMYSEVYFHKNAIAGSFLLEKILENCDMDKLIQYTKNPSMFMLLDDSILQMIAHGLFGDKAIPYAFAYLRRDLPKVGNNGEIRLQKHINMFDSKQFEHIRIDGKVFEDAVKDSQYLYVDLTKIYFIDI